MSKKEFIDEKIIELLDQVENYAGEYPKDEPHENVDVIEQSLETSFIVDRKKVEFERRVMIEDKLTIMLPINFDEMDAEAAKLKYPSEQRPPIIYTDPSNLVNFWVSPSEEFVSEDGVENLRDQIFSMISRLNPGIKPQQSGVEIVSQKKVAYIEYSNPTLDSKIYNLMFLFAIDEKMTAACFNCLTKDSKYWKKPMFEMLKSMQFTNVEKERS